MCLTRVAGGSRDSELTCEPFVFPVDDADTESGGHISPTGLSVTIKDRGSRVVRTEARLCRQIEWVEPSNRERCEQGNTRHNRPFHIGAKFANPDFLLR